MTVHEGAWPTGAPCWVELLVDDVGAATGFYSALFGWDLRTVDDAPGHVHLVADEHGRAVTGMRQAPPVRELADQWVTYLATPTVQGTLDAARAAGGVVLSRPEGDPTGTSALLRDPTGAVVGLWSPGLVAGAEVTDVPGTVTWNELMSTDVDRAAAFYSRVLGWTLRDLGDPAISYRTFEAGGRTAGGLGHAVDAPGDGPHRSRWWVYLKVDDVDATTAEVPRHGGDVVREPFDSTFGRIAVLAGPSGEQFCVLADNRAGT